MAAVAGVDFGTLSVRVSIVDSDSGLLASATADYPLHRKREAVEITEATYREGLEAINRCGEIYSSEWGFSKLPHWLRNNPENRSACVSASDFGHGPPAR